jgi:hypothetical protein
MVKSRIYTFIISNYTDELWNNLIDVKETDQCEYLIMCKNDDDEISNIYGYIRFYNQRHKESIQKNIFKNAAVILNTTEKFDRLKYLSQHKHYESGRIHRQQKSKYDIEYEIENMKNTIQTQNLQINNLQTLQMEQKDKIIEEQSAQFKQVMDVCLSLAKNMPSIETHTNSHNKVKNKFNLNFFLNEQCKDAVNLIDFVKGIQLEMKDMLLHNQVGFAEAISQIFIKSMGNMDLTQRPIHCTDLKRETLYVRNDSQWCNDGDKKITDRAIETLTNRNYGQMKKWKDENPDYLKSPEKNREYIVLTRNMMGGSSDKEQDANTRKIIHNIAKATHLDKEVLKNNIKKKPDKTIENTTIL